MPSTEAVQTARARVTWGRSTRLAGVLGERYLIEHRGIPKPDWGWPDDAVRFDSINRHLILAGTTDDGSIQFIQRVKLLDDGSKNNSPNVISKETNGPTGGAFIRLPGTVYGPLLIGEGPETCISACAATGYETYACAGGQRLPEGLGDRQVIVLQDDGDEDSDRSFMKKMQEWTAAGANVYVATPWAERRRDKSDFNDVIKEGGAQAVRDRIAASERIEPPPPPKPHFRRPHMSRDAASRRLRRVTSAFLNQVERYLDCCDWIAAQAAQTVPEVEKELEKRWIEKLNQENTGGKVSARVSKYLRHSNLTIDIWLAAHEHLVEILTAGDDAEAQDEICSEAAERAKKSAPTVAKGRARRDAARMFGKRAAEGSMSRIQIRGAASLGKTNAFISEYLRRPSLWNRHVYFYARTLDLAEEFERDLWSMAREMKLPADARPKVKVIRGREFEGMCNKDRLTIVREVQEKGLSSTYQATCHTVAMGGIGGDPRRSPIEMHAGFRLPGDSQDHHL